MKKWEIRKFIKDTFGFNSSIKKHSMINDVVTIMIPEIGIGTANVFGKEVLDKHRELFKYVNGLKGIVLDSNERII